MQEDIQNENEVRTEPIIGKFKPKRKFLNFVSAVNGARVRFIRDVAFVKGEKLSGVLEGVIFKITICDEGTINFEEQKGSNLTDESMIKRLIADIDDKDVTGYAQKFVVAGIEFNDINGDRCYLEVEHQKPINKLKSLFEENDEKVEVSQKSLSLLDDLFGSSDDEEEEISSEDAEVLIKEVEATSETNEKLKTTAEIYMEEQFRKMNEAKIMELEYRIEETQKEIVRYQNESKQAEKKAEEKSEALGVLETRLESMKPGDDPNGYVFYVSEEQKEMESLSEEEKKIALRISDIMKLKGDVIVKMLTEGYYKIKIAKADDISNTEFELDKDVYQKIMTLDIDGKMKVSEDGFEYRGKLNWHQLVQKMIRGGFSQSPEFDKICNSNSYESHEEDKSTEMDLGNSIVVKSNEGFVEMGNGVFGIPPSNTTTIDSEVKTKKLTSYSETSDFVILGCDYDGNHDIEITDDYTGLDIYEGGKRKFSIESDGFVSIMSIDGYKNWVKEFAEDCGDACDAVLVSGYQGDIRVGAKLEDGTFSSDFNFNDYIQHQIDDCESVFINFPPGTQINEIKNHDLNSVIHYLRDTKINKIITNE